MKEDVILIIKQERALLQFLLRKKTAMDPAECAWEIKLYDYLLEDTSRVAQYHAARYPKSGETLSKRETVAKLGWRIE